MADAEIDININRLYGLLDDVPKQLEEFAETVAKTVRKNAPYGKRSKSASRTQKVDLHFRLIEKMKLGEHDYVRPQMYVNEKWVDYEFSPAVHDFLMQQMKPMLSGKYEITGTIKSKTGADIQYPLWNARLVGAKDASPAAKRMNRRSVKDVGDLEQMAGKPKTYTGGHLETGPHLRDSIEVEPVTEKDMVWSVEIIAMRPYAIFVEEGTRKQKAQHFMKNSLIEHAADIESGRVFSLDKSGE